MPKAPATAFATTLVAIPVWFVMLLSSATEINEPGVLAYGLLLVVLAIPCAYLTARGVAPWLSRLTWPLAAPWSGGVMLGIGLVVLVSVGYAYGRRMTAGGGTMLGVLAWYLLVSLGPPALLGCLAHLVVITRAGQKSAG